MLDKAKKILGSKYECNAYKIDDLIVDVKNYGRNYKQCLGSQLQPCVGADGNVSISGFSLTSDKILRVSSVGTS